MTTGDGDRSTGLKHGPNHLPTDIHGLELLNLFKCSWIKKINWNVNRLRKHPSNEARLQAEKKKEEEAKAIALEAEKAAKEATEMAAAESQRKAAEALTASQGAVSTESGFGRLNKAPEGNVLKGVESALKMEESRLQIYKEVVGKGFASEMDSNRVVFLEDKPHVKGVINNVMFMPWAADDCFTTCGNDHVVVLWTAHKFAFFGCDGSSGYATKTYGGLCWC
ncbi:hypothetical protein Hanom_Chr05g00431591 [Helianthus anomalus]